MEPLLKWAGGKRWLLNKMADVLPMEENFNRYFEPFVGSGAIFFHLEPSSGVISDLNNDLINTYNSIKTDWKKVLQMLKQYDRLHSSEFYYKTRGTKYRSPISRAAQFIYLNRTCWNGLYRVNQKGEFNVPKGSKEKVLFENDDFELLATLLGRVEIKCCDFEETIDATDRGDFLFVDPPYTVKHNLNGFIKYNEKIFSWDDQIRLCNSIKRAEKRGVSILVTNANHKSIHELYRGIGQSFKLQRASVISGKPSGRGIYSEVAIKCNL